MLVVDASAALHLLASRDGLERLRGHEPVAPALLWSEVTSVVREMSFRGEISHDLAAIMVDRMSTSPIARRASAALYRGAIEVAGELGWAKTYDAEYVALARSLGAPLLTRDARLRRGASSVVEFAGPDDL